MSGRVFFEPLVLRSNVKLKSVSAHFCTLPPSSTSPLILIAIDEFCSSKRGFIALRPFSCLLWNFWVLKCDDYVHCAVRNDVAWFLGHGNGKVTENGPFGKVRSPCAWLGVAGQIPQHLFAAFLSSHSYSLFSASIHTYSTSYTRFKHVSCAPWTATCSTCCRAGILETFGLLASSCSWKKEK